MSTQFSIFFLGVADGTCFWKTFMNASDCIGVGVPSIANSGACQRARFKGAVEAIELIKNQRRVESGLAEEQMENLKLE
jgi:hypothetical protein